MIAVRFREDPRTGQAATFSKAADPAIVAVASVGDHDSAASCVERWLAEPFVADTARHESVFVAIRRLALRTGESSGTTDAAYAVVSRGRILARMDFDTRFAVGVGFTSRTTISTRAVSTDQGNVLFVRADSAGIAGSERYTVFGAGPSGAFSQFTGPTEYFRDADLPVGLTTGQVVYTRVQMGWFSVPLPLTFEPRRARFVPEVGDDAMFTASGKAAFRGDAAGSSLIHLFSSTAPGASMMTVPIPPLTEAVARKAFLPALVAGHRLHAIPHAGMVYVSVGSLEGWLPDSLYDQFRP
jgi:hypothetical protein